MSRFILADLQIRAILREPSAKLAKSALEHLTKNVNNYYNQAMQRIVSQEETRDMVYNLLTWLTFTHSPIHVHELELALSIRPGQSLDHDLDDQRVDVLRYVSLSEGLISINKSSLSSPDDESSDEKIDQSEREKSTMNERKISMSKGAQVTLAHESIREFLRDSSQPGFPANGDKYLLHCCLTIMSSPIFVENLRQIWGQLLYRNDFPWRAKKEFSVKSGSLAVKVPVFLFWALSTWGQHVSDVKVARGMENAIKKIQESPAGATTAQSRMKLPGPLYWCAYEGWAAACKLLLPLEKEPNSFFHLMMDRGMTHATRETCVFAAVASGDVATVEVFLGDDRIKPDLGKYSYYQGHVTPLMQACEQGDKDIVQMLVERNDVNVNAYHGGSYGAGLPAILRARPGITSILLERDDLDVNTLRLGRRPIHHLASIGGPPSDLELLLDKGKTDVNGRTAEKISRGGKYVRGRDKVCFHHERTALMVAAFVGTPAQTSVLLKHPRIDLQLRDSQGMTPLMLASVGWGAGTLQDIAEPLASSQQHDETVRILLKSSDLAINERDVRGRTALIFASMGHVDPRWDGSTTSCEGLEGLDLKFWYENLARNASLGKRHHIEIVKALLTDGKVDVNIHDNMGHTALDYAMWTRDFIIQEHIWNMKSLRKGLESPWLDGPGSGGLYRVPDVDLEDFMTEAQSRIDAMSKIQDVLVASGAHSSEPIPSIALPEEDRTPQGFLLKEVEATEKQKMLESLISALESVV